MMIAAENIRFSYGSGGTVFDRFSFGVARGEILAVIGPSGGGKTTLLYLLAGLRMPSSGRIRINGKPLLRPRPGNGRYGGRIQPSWGCWEKWTSM